MRILVDTNVLLRCAQPASPDHLTASQSLLAIDAAHLTSCLVPQVIYEYRVVATRPVAVNGLGMDIATVDASVENLIRNFSVLRDERGIFHHWRTLVRDGAVRGKEAHDARLVAAMGRHGLTNLLTFNPSDFIRYPSITIHSPASVVRDGIK